MTEITQADRDAVERLIETVSMTRNSLAEAFARHRMEERAAIVALVRRKSGLVGDWLEELLKQGSI